MYLYGQPDETWEGAKKNSHDVIGKFQLTFILCISSSSSLFFSFNPRTFEAAAALTFFPIYITIFFSGKNLSVYICSQFFQPQEGNSSSMVREEATGNSNKHKDPVARAASFL